MKKTIYNGLLVLALAMLVVSCSTKRKANSILLKPTGNSEKQYQFDYDAARRGVFLSTKEGNLNVLSEVPPDVALAKTSELQMKLLGKLKDTDISAEMASKMSENITELGRRTIAVNILRDALFRLNAMTFEGRALDANQVVLFKEIVQAATDIAKQEAEVQKEKTEGEKQKLKQIQKEGELIQMKMDVTSGNARFGDLGRVMAISHEKNDKNMERSSSDALQWEKKAILCLILRDINCAFSAAEKGVELDSLFGHIFELRSILSKMKSQLMQPDSNNWIQLKERIGKLYSDDKIMLDLIGKI